VSELSLPSSEATTISQLSSLSHTPNLSGTATPNRLPHDEKGLDEDFDVSDVDTDIEPDELVSTYVATKARLFKLRPELVQENISKKKSFKGPPVRPEYSPSPGIRKLQQKLRRIESDYLFDSDSAGQKWATERVQIMREEPQTRGRGRTRNQEGPDNHVAAPNPEPKLPSALAISEDSDSDSSDEEFMLGDMFAVPNEGSGPMKPPGKDATSNSAVFLRDFGKYTGLNPRRVLEDACRARWVTWLFDIHEESC
jgi:ATP-dependent RNA helicase DHX29